MNSPFIQVLKWLVNIAWYLLLPIAIIGAIAIGIMIGTNNYLDWDVPVVLKQVDNLPGIQPANALYKYAGVKQAEARLIIKAKPTPAMIAMVVVVFGCGMFLIFGVIHQLRKILSSLKAGTPFAYGNIRRLRLISLFIFLLAVLRLLAGLGNILLFRKQFPAAGEIYWPQAQLGLAPLIASLIVLILAEVFKQGYQLKTENESFV
jgi:hypothetical protein